MAALFNFVIIYGSNRFRVAEIFNNCVNIDQYGRMETSS
jgi:hypothetical protein